MKKLSRVSLLSVALLTGCQSTPLQNTFSMEAQKVEEPTVQEKAQNMMAIPEETTQVIRVITPSWNAKEGTLQRYVRSAEGWQKVGEAIDIILGRNGLGWGRGLHTIPGNPEYIKREGDGKAPAGLFRLGQGFGYDALKIAFPYEVYQRTDHCVDDSRSQWYNRIIDSTQTDKDYASFERMKLNSEEYKYGITVDHNPEQIAQGGSCIFIHIRNGKGKGTAGCTAMREGEIVQILKWLKPEAHPLLLQLPVSELHRVAESSLR